MKQKILTGHLLAIFSGFLISISLFLPWATLGRIKVSGFDKIGDAKILFFSGLLVILIGILSLGLKTNKIAGIYLIALVVNVGLLIYIYFVARDNLSSLTIFNRTPEIGIGFYLCAFGTIVLFVSSILLSEKRKKAK